MASVYDTLRWQLVRLRAISRDGGSCTVSRFLGAGDCSPGAPHVHHVVPLEDGGDPYDLANLATTCPAHHGMWEPLRRLLVERIVNRHELDAPRCNHHHRSASARRECEARMARRRRVGVAA